MTSADTMDMATALAESGAAGAVGAATPPAVDPVTMPPDPGKQRVLQLLRTQARLQTRITDALVVAIHHVDVIGRDSSAQWVVDQMIRRLLGDSYGAWTAHYAREAGKPWPEGSPII